MSFQFKFNGILPPLVLFEHVDCQKLGLIQTSGYSSGMDKLNSNLKSLLCNTYRRQISVSVFASCDSAFTDLDTAVGIESYVYVEIFWGEVVMIFCLLMDELQTAM